MRKLLWLLFRLIDNNSVELFSIYTENALVGAGGAFQIGVVQKNGDAVIGKLNVKFHTVSTRLKGRLQRHQCVFGITFRIATMGD